MFSSNCIYTNAKNKKSIKRNFNITIYGNCVNLTKYYEIIPI